MQYEKQIPREVENREGTRIIYLIAVIIAYVTIKSKEWDKVRIR